ncbi:hypothetical protein WN51_12690 [Melipona quadrifasciata]|uniref:Uncharacterized protein n=1 Tax=Melipona quadrifasciata TaxID=166423 RepID=A0A0M9A0R2_9HYME|nr:hypothetical protein WN51_12690 [Melipona quadrifasciata]
MKASAFIKVIKLTLVHLACSKRVNKALERWTKVTNGRNKSEWINGPRNFSHAESSLFAGTSRTLNQVYLQGIFSLQNDGGSNHEKKFLMLMKQTCSLTTTSCKIILKVRLNGYYRVEHNVAEHGSVTLPKPGSSDRSTTYVHVCMYAGSLGSTITNGAWPKSPDNSVRFVLLKGPEATVLSSLPWNFIDMRTFESIENKLVPDNATPTRVRQRCEAISLIRTWVPFLCKRKQIFPSRDLMYNVLYRLNVLRILKYYRYAVAQLTSHYVLHLKKAISEIIFSRHRMVGYQFDAGIFKMYVQYSHEYVHTRQERLRLQSLYECIKIMHHDVILRPLFVGDSSTLILKIFKISTGRVIKIRSIIK